MKSISTVELAKLQEQNQSFLLLDVRKAQAVKTSAVKIHGAQWKDPALWLEWKDTIPNDKPVVMYCAHGQEISQALSTALHVMKHDVCYLTGGIAAWQKENRSLEKLPL